MQVNPTAAPWSAADFLTQATATITRAITQASPIALYGAGQTGRLVASCLSAELKDKTIFIDDTPAKAGSVLDGIPVLSLASAHEKYGSQLVVVVCIFSPGHRLAATKKKLEEQFGWTVCSFAEVLLLKADALPYQYLDAPARQVLLQNAYAHIFSRLSDQRSRDVLLENLRMRLLADFSGMVDARSAMDFLDLPDDARLSYVDCGAYDGDTVQDFLQWRGEGFEKIIAFEPDPANFIKLTERISHLDAKLRARIDLREEAIWSFRGSISFSTSHSTASAISDEGEGSVRTEMLDAVAYLPDPLLLKLDVEGAEWEAVSGGLELIQTRRPIVAISVYHKPEDLVDLFQRINALALDYRFFLRCHGGDGMDLVLYCVPPPIGQKAK